MDQQVDKVIPKERETVLKVRRKRKSKKTSKNEIKKEIKWEIKYVGETDSKSESETESKTVVERKCACGCGCEGECKIDYPSDCDEKCFCKLQHYNYFCEVEDDSDSDRFGNDYSCYDDI